MLVNNRSAPPMKKPEIIMLHEIMAVFIDILKKDCNIQVPEPEVQDTTDSVVQALEYGIENLVKYIESEKDPLPKLNKISSSEHDKRDALQLICQICNNFFNE